VVFAIGDASSARSDHVSCSIASDNGTIVPGEWMTLVARYSAVSNSVDLLKNGRSASWRASLGAPVACDSAFRHSINRARTVATSFVGKRVGAGPDAGHEHHELSDAYFSGDMMGVQILDSYVEDSVAMAIGEALQHGYSGSACCGLSTPQAPVACASCEAGKYSSTTGTDAGAVYFSTCTACPAHSTSPPGSNNATACQCLAGYTGPNGATCVACTIGKYKSSLGSEPCGECTAAEGYFCGVASASATGIRCPAGFYCAGGSSDKMLE